MGLKGGISINADSGPPRYVLWCCGGICHQLLTFFSDWLWPYCELEQDNEKMELKNAWHFHLSLAVHGTKKRRKMTLRIFPYQTRHFYHPETFLFGTDFQRHIKHHFQGPKNLLNIKDRLHWMRKYLKIQQEVFKRCMTGKHQNSRWSIAIICSYPNEPNCNELKLKLKGFFMINTNAW